MRRLFEFTAAAMVLAVLVGGRTAEAEEVPDLALVGARARAMGGAYIAVADGVDAVAWNPAGLVEVGHPSIAADSRLSFGSGTVLHGLPTFNAGGFGDVPVLGFTDSPGTRFTYYFIEGAAPLPVEGQLKSLGLVGAVGYRRVIDLTFRQEQLLQFDPGGGQIIPIEHTDDSDGGVDAFSLSLAGRLMPRVSLGANFNVLTGFINNADITQVSAGGTQVFLVEQRTIHDIEGFSLELGARIKVLPQVTVGGVLRPGYDIDFNRGRGKLRRFTIEGGPLPPENLNLEGPVADRTRAVPTFYDFGIAATPFPGWLVAGDFQYRPWNETVDTFHDQATGQTFVIDPDLYEAHSFHVGGEYTFRRQQSIQVPVRLGFRTHPTTLANIDSLSADVGANGFRTYHGDRVEGKTWSGGVGIHFPTVGFDVSLDRTALTFSEFSEYFPVPPLPGEPLRIVEIEEKITNLYFSSTLRF